MAQICHHILIIVVLFCSTVIETYVPKVFTVPVGILSPSSPLSQILTGVCFGKVSCRMPYNFYYVLLSNVSYLKTYPKFSLLVSWL